MPGVHHDCFLVDGLSGLYLKVACQDNRTMVETISFGSRTMVSAIWSLNLVEISVSKSARLRNR